MSITAVEWLMTVIKHKRDFNLEESFQEALNMEKEQIIDAWIDGYDCNDIDERLEINKSMFSAEKYYNKTYNK